MAKKIKITSMKNNRRKWDADITNLFKIRKKSIDKKNKGSETIKCRECELASDVFAGAIGSPKLCKITGFVYAAEYTCHIDDEEREEMLKGEMDLLNKLKDEIHQNAIEHGWWEEERSFGDIIALCHSELSEALEEYRNGHKPNEVYFNLFGKEIPGIKEGEKPEGIAIELADVIIRILDYCGHERIDIEAAIRIKHEYNKTRPYKHGGKKI